MLFFFLFDILLLVINMKFKKIYIEITNVCNLNCSFCAHTTRKQEFITLKNFEIILNKIKPYTNYIYLHVMGEPLLHPDINKIILLANKYDIKVNITTNGSLIERLNEDADIRQINVSLHSYNEQLDSNNYLEKVFNKCEIMASRGVYINYRLWTDKNFDLKMKLEKKYNVIINDNDVTKTLDKNIFYSKENEFVWPVKRLGEGKCSTFSSTCRALKDHIAILVDGTVVPCCLDNNGIIKLGNIFHDSLESIINSTVYEEMLHGFNNNQKINDLCKNCNFYTSKL